MKNAHRFRLPHCFHLVLLHASFCTLVSFCAGLVFFPSPLFALDPKKRLTQYDIKVYLAKHGLPMNAQKDIFQDSRGFIWIATQEGLLRFDGVRFVLFDKKNLPGLREYFIWNIAEDWEGNLWLATNGGGVSCFNGKSIIATYDTTNGLASNVVFAVTIGKDHAIWLGTENGVTRLKDGRFVSYKFGDLSGAQTIYALHEDRRGNLLVGSAQAGLHIIRKDSLFTLPAEGNTIYSFHERANGEVILASGGRLYVYHSDHGDSVRKFISQKLPSYHAIRALHEDQDGNLWLATEGNGIVRYHAGEFEALTVQNGLPGYNNYFCGVMEDREKSLWFTSDGGLFQLHDNKIFAFGRNDGASDNGYTICEGETGEMWAAFRGYGLVQFGANTAKFWGAEHGLFSNEIPSVFPARTDGVWIGTVSGLNYIKDQKIYSYPFKDGMDTHIILALHENAQGELWIGIASGYLAKFDGKKFQYWRLTNESSGDIIAVIETANKEVWAGTRKKGLYKFSEEKIRRFTEKDGIAAEGINAFYEDSTKVLWIATDGQGLYRYKDGAFSHFTSANGLYFDRLFAILEDDRGNLWFSGNRGIFCTSKQQLIDFAEGKADTILCQAYSDLDGMRETECNGRRQPVAWKSRDGRLWFVSIAGVVCVDPNNMPINTLPPPVYIEELLVNNESKLAPDSSSIALAAPERELEFRFTAPSFVVPERVKFKYKLEGYDQNWVEAGTRRSAFYTNLPKGQYTFRVIACNNDGLWNEEGANVQLSIAPFWWETWWAYSLYGLALIGAFFGIRQYEVKRLGLRNELKLEHVRTERLKELDHLKSRFFAGISHEFRTPLTLIGGPLEEMFERTRKAKQKSELAMMLRNTQRLQRLVDQLLDLAQFESGKMSLQARPVRLVPFLQGLVAAFESYARQKNIQLVFPADDSFASTLVFVDPDKMEKVFANLLFNALKYTSSGGSVEVAVSSGSGTDGQVLLPTATELEVSIRDTGVGIPEKALPHLFDYFYRYRDQNTRRESGTGIGLALSKELVELHGGKISVASVEGKGSEFVVHLPLGKTHLKPEEIASDQLSVISDAADGKLQVRRRLIFQQPINPPIQPSSIQQPATRNQSFCWSKTIPICAIIFASICSGITICSKQPTARRVCNKPRPRFPIWSSAT